MDPREQERVIAAMLRKRVAETGAGPATNCPAPEILAAYYECSLGVAEQAQHEAHFASCPRCQAQLAAMVRAEPEPQSMPHWAWLTDWRRAAETPAAAIPRHERLSLSVNAAPATAAARSAAEPKRRFEWLTSWRYAWRWLAPTAALAVAVAIWVAVRPPRQQSLNVTQVASTDRNKVAEALGALGKQKQEAQKNTVAAPPPPAPASTSRVTEQHRRRAVESKGLSAKVMSPAPAASPGFAAGTAAGTASRKQAEALNKAAEQSVESAAGKATATDQTVMVEAAPEAPAKTMSQRAAKEAPREMMREQVESPAANEAAKTTAGQLKLLEIRSREALITSPDPSVQWRLGPAGSIEHSEDGGKTWAGQFADVNVKLLAGSAPTTKICWIVGSMGTVLRTTDGERWEKVTAPATVDLVGVQARDAKSAEVTAADGRKFSTEDGGKTWRITE
jgi:photosynthesis system II assembly factor YCF48-like protein